MPSIAEQIRDEMADAPVEVQREVLDFAKFVKLRAGSEQVERAHQLDLAQTSWASDWDNPEEDAAWASL